MLGISVLAMFVIVAVSFTSICYAENENETKPPESAATSPTATAVDETSSPNVAATPTTTPTATPSPSPTPPKITINKTSFMPNESINVTVIAPSGTENVTIRIVGQTSMSKEIQLKPETETAWKGAIGAPQEPGEYDIAVFVEDNEQNKTSFEVVSPPPLWKRFWWLFIPLIGVCIAGGVFLFLLISSKEKENAKLTVQVRKEKGDGLKGAKVTVDWEKGVPKTKRTDEIGMTQDFVLPVGKCEIKVEKEGYEIKQLEREIKKRGGNKEDVYLKPVGHIGKFLEVNVVDKEGKKVKEVRVRISRGINDFDEDITNEFGYCNLEMPKVKGQVYVFAKKEGYEKAKKPISMEQPPIKLLVEIKRKLAELKLNVFSEDNEPLSDAVVKIDDKEFFTNLRGVVTGKVSWGVHKLLITKEGYEPYEETVNVEGDTSPPKIKLTTKFGALKVTVVDEETWEPVDGIKVDVKGAAKITNKEGFVSFDKIEVGRQTIEVRDPTVLYSSQEPKMVEIKEKITTPIEIKLSSSFEIPDSKMEKLREAYKYLVDQRARVAAYDSYLPGYYMKVGEKLVGIVSDSGKSRKLLRLVRGIRDITPTVFVEDLADVISNGCMEIGKGMRERRNLEIFEDIKRFVVDKDLAKANVEVRLKDVESEDIKKYIERGRGGVEELLREVDQSLTKTAGNNYPMSVLFKVARQIMNSDTRSDDKAKALVASVILEYVKVMLKDENVKERLRGLIT